MKKGIALLLVALLVLCCLSATAESKAAEVGKSMEDFSVTLLDGTEFKLSEHRGKVVFVNVWATWCPPCIAEMPDIQKLAEAYPEELVVLGLNYCEKEKTVRAFIEENGYTYPIGLDTRGKVNKTFFPTNGYPYSIFIDGKGVVRHVRLGGGYDMYDVFETYLKDTLTPAVPKTHADGIVFPSERVEAAAMKAAGIKEGLIGAKEAAAAKSLDVSGMGISDISFLSSFTGLETLNLGQNEARLGNYIKDVSILEGLTNLRELDLSGNGISDISVLAGLTQLTTLRMDGNKIKDLTPIQNLVQLQTLSAADNEISKLKALSGLTELTSLDISFNRAKDLSPLKGLTKLRYLGGSGNGVSNLKPLKELTELTELYLYYNSIKSLEPLAGLVNLTALDLYSNKVSDVKPLAGMTKMEKLWLDSNKVKDVSPLAGMTQLTLLYLENNPIKDYSPLAGLTKLTETDYPVAK